MTNTHTIGLNVMCLENDLVKSVIVSIAFLKTNTKTVASGDVSINRSTNMIRKISREAIPNAVARRNPGKRQRVTYQDRRARFSRVPRLRLNVSFIKHFFNTVMYSSSTEEANLQTSGLCIVKLWMIFSPTETELPKGAPQIDDPSALRQSKSFGLTNVKITNNEP